MPHQPKSRNPYVSSTVRPRSTKSRQWQRNRRVAPARARMKRGRRRGLAVALIAVVLVGIIVAVSAFFITRLIPQFTSQNDRIRVELSEDRVLSDFRALELTPPDIAFYRYVETGNLIGPRFDEATIDDLQGTVAADDVTRTTHSDAIWRNRDVTVYEAMEVVYSYDVAAETWKSGPAHETGLTVKPNVAPSAGLIADDLFTLLRQSDPSMASRLDGATVKTESSLTVDGGTITATVSKREGSNVITATVPMTVSWSDDQGWVPEIGHVTTETSSVAPSVANAESKQQNASGAQQQSGQSSGGTQGSATQR